MKCSKVFDVAIVGSGIGGTLIAALNQNKNIIVFEKDKNVGGCASTFKRFGNYYNAGATTFMGYEEGHIIKKMFDAIGFYPNIKKSQTAIRVIQGNTVIDRQTDFEAFLEQIQEAYPNKNNRKFWQTIKEIDEKFWQLNDIYYSKKNITSYLKSAWFFIRLFKTYKGILFKSACSFIETTLGKISREYENFINAQLLITVQSTYQTIPLLSMALGLAYPFHKVYYVNGGMGSLIEELLKEINVHTQEEVLCVYKDKKFYRIVTNKQEYCAYNVVLNSTVYDSGKLFVQEDIQNYYQQFSLHDQSAFVLYMILQTQEEFLHHYQIILEKTIPHTLSNSFFVSFSDQYDEKLSKNGYSITISCHTKALFWKELNPKEYEEKKLQTQEFLVQAFLEHFKMLQRQNIVYCFSATSKTFQRYAHRLNCGGNKLSLKSFFNLPCASTPFSGLYNVGDTLFSGQGWPGVALGVEILHKELNETNVCETLGATLKKSCKTV